MGFSQVPKSCGQVLHALGPGTHYPLSDRYPPLSPAHESHVLLHTGNHGNNFRIHISSGLLVRGPRPLDRERNSSHVLMVEAYNHDLGPMRSTVRVRPPVVAWWGQVLVVTDISDTEFGEDTKGPAQSVLDLSFYSVPQFLQLRKGIHDTHVCPKGGKRAPHQSILYIHPALHNALRKLHRHKPGGLDTNISLQMRKQRHRELSRGRNRA